MTYLPDTNVFSRYLRGRREDATSCDCLELHLSTCVLSAIVLMELTYGAAKEPAVTAFHERVTRLRRIFPIVAAFDAAAAEQAGQVRAQLSRLRPNAAPIGPYDVLLAGQAVSLGAVLVTDNTAEFTRVPGLAVENWQRA